MKRSKGGESTDLDATGVQGFGQSPSVVDLSSLHAEEEYLHKLRQMSRMRSSEMTGSGSEVPSQHAAPPGFVLATLPLVTQGAGAIVDDSFTRCFKEAKQVAWNWNIYLFPAWCLGIFLRYAVLFPLRVLSLIFGFTFVGLTFPVVKFLGAFVNLRHWETFLIQLLASAFVASWSGVIRIHGIRPTPRPGQPAGVFVANHSSMIDFVVLLQSHPYAVVGQKHPGWVGFIQDSLLNSLNCIWFNRGESNDRKVVAERLRAHSHDQTKSDCPLLVFPEGTCVNNEYVVQFKKGVFELGVPINPIAVKYNKVFVDGYWNSREQSFGQHLLRLMTSWAVVCDVWFMDPQYIRANETPEQFATRVQQMVAARAGIEAVDWDGYMKYWKPSARFISARQKSLADDILHSLGMADEPSTPYITEQQQSSESSGARSARTSSANDTNNAGGLPDQGLASFPDQEAQIAGLEAAQKHAEASMHALSASARIKTAATMSPALFGAHSPLQMRRATSGGTPTIVSLPLQLPADGFILSGNTPTSSTHKTSTEPAASSTSDFEIGDEDGSDNLDVTGQTEVDAESKQGAQTVIRQRKRVNQA